jgi:hypothetical protein
MDSKVEIRFGELDDFSQFRRTEQFWRRQQEHFAKIVHHGQPGFLSKVKEKATMRVAFSYFVTRLVT